MIIGKRLTILRKKLGYNQQDFSKTLGVSLSAYKKYEQGVYDPPLAMIIKIFEKYRISYQWLLHGEGSIEALNYSDLLEKAVIKTKLGLDQRELEIGIEKEAQIICAVFENMLKNHASEDGNLAQLLKVAL